MREVRNLHETREEYEGAVFSSFVLSEEARPVIAGIVKPEDFSDPVLREAYRTGIKMWERGILPDVLTMAEEISRKGKRDFKAVLNKLLETLNISIILNQSGAGEYAKKLREISLHKKMKEKLLKAVEEKRLDETLAVTEKVLFSTMAELERINTENRTAVMVKDALTHIEKIATARLQGISTPATIRTGFEELDEKLAGFEPGSYVVVAARPGMGKTAFMLSMALNMIGNGERVAFFSLEMPGNLIVTRLISQLTGIPFLRLRTGQISSDELVAVREAGEYLMEAPLFIDDTADLTPERFRARVELLRKTRGVSVVFVDYIQLIKTSRKYDSRQQEIAHVSQTLKRTVLTSEILLVAASQLSREVEKRTDKKPRLSDLRESGALEQDADVVMFIYRKDYYSGREDDAPVTDIIIEKNRNGPCGVVRLVFRKDIMKFTSRSEPIHEEFPF